MKRTIKFNRYSSVLLIDYKPPFANHYGWKPIAYVSVWEEPLGACARLNIEDVELLICHLTELRRKMRKGIMRLITPHKLYSQSDIGTAVDVGDFRYRITAIASATEIELRKFRWFDYLLPAWLARWF